MTDHDRRANRRAALLGLIEGLVTYVNDSPDIATWDAEHIARVLGSLHGLIESDRPETALDPEQWLRQRTVYTDHPSVYYEPYVGVDGRVGYHCQTNNAGDTRETFLYFNPSTDTDDGVPNVFIYRGENNDPAYDTPDCHIPLHELEDGPLLDCGHTMHQRDEAGGGCYGCYAEEPRHDA